MSKSESWWVVVINLGGVHKPVKCYKPADNDSHTVWDKSGEYECDMRAGVWPLTSLGDECTKFQTTSKREADLFYSGAQSVAKLLHGIFGSL